MNMQTPDFETMEDSELRRVVSELQLQRDLFDALLLGAQEEQKNRRADKREGIFKNRPPAQIEEPKVH